MKKTIILTDLECLELKVAISILLDQEQKFIDCYGKATDCSCKINRVKELQGILKKLV